MSKNLIPIIAKELGVEIGEEFKIKGITLYKYRINNDKLEVKLLDDKWETSTLSISLLGDIEIIKLPFEPKTGDEYWTYSETWEVEDWVWTYDFLDLVYKRVGIVFRTKEEAIKARPDKYKELTSKEWKE